LRIHPSGCINYIEEATSKTASAANKRWQFLEFEKFYSPPIHGTGSGKPKESLRNDLARRHLLY
jgi:hypothetical protein